MRRLLTVFTGVVIAIQVLLPSFECAAALR